MHLLINAASAHMGGAVTYLRNILQWLPEVAPDDRWVTYVPDATRERLAGLQTDRVELRSYPFKSTQGWRRIYFDQIEIPRILRREGFDGLYSATGFGTFVSPCFQVLAIRNMAYFDPAFHNKYRELERSLRRNRVRRWYSLLSMRRADAVLFPTRAMQSAVEKYMPLGHTPTYVIHYGFDADRFADNGQTGDLARRMREWKQQGYRLLLNVSTYAVHKNLETVVDALAQLDSEVRVKLVTTTSREQTSDTAEYDRLHARAAELHVSDRWAELGYVPYKQLHGVYQAADAYIFPSFCESFGHSMLEAMASGLPVIAAGTAVNREVCGPAGTYFDTFDAADCARVISRVLSDETLQQEHRIASRERADQFSWREHTARLVDIFRSAGKTSSR